MYSKLSSSPTTNHHQNHKQDEEDYLKMAHDLLQQLTQNYNTLSSTTPTTGVVAVVQPNIICYNTLFNAHAKRGNVYQILQYMFSLLQHNDDDTDTIATSSNNFKIHMDVVSYTSLLDGIAHSLDFLFVDNKKKSGRNNNSHNSNNNNNSDTRRKIQNLI
mmetsp:Transcript_21982/g.32712  ORF Transcript_21982/g.32712 Transcript_21982/m.32712 type:complete len:160 (-) Transcript_21982:412-891(-)